MSDRGEVLDTLRGLGYGEDDATTLADHFLDAEARGKRGHGLTRVEWLTTLTDLDPSARPETFPPEAFNTLAQKIVRSPPSL